MHKIKKVKYPPTEYAKRNKSLKSKSGSVLILFLGLYFTVQMYIKLSNYTQTDKNSFCSEKKEPLVINQASTTFISIPSVP